MTTMISPVLLHSLFAGRRLSAAESEDLAATLKAAADPVRLRILNLLDEHGEMTAADLTPLIGKSQPTVSHHVGILRTAGLVKARQAGVFMHLSIDADGMAQLAKLIAPRGRR